ncbi:hypothetical protein BTIS_1081 [Bifidobacterium tissieri]|uniref:DUF433 domain-containing protein n=1 Tax=Bifidobacterium tissieri TaxID=1630162 RepID=A0A261FF84_9BIFI|nr:antitoxin [Bifidobacterium tissieri]OZG57840.1 hypothetical protein BTIS_1081 [Bifidobacterium tissieri]
MTVKAYTREMIIKWHRNHYTIDEIAPLIPFATREEIEAIIATYETQREGRQ